MSDAEFETEREWYGDSSAPFAYSDGDAVEEHLLSILRGASDLSCASAELREHLSDWPSEYHLGPERHCLLRPFSFGPGQRVLELGAGCGAITRYLGETGADVVAVEGSARRAEITRERCRDLQNVSVHCLNLTDFASNERFDVVTLIGVLEYAPCYIEAPNPIAACLAHARQLLKPDGVLILAIENRMGLKYFNGHAEDHVGRPFYGIYGLYQKKDPVTFGRTELVQRLQAAGLPAQSFLFPFPDYKQPRLILTQPALQEPDVSVPCLLALMASRDLTGQAPPVFHEPLTWESIVTNGLVQDLSNSFLVLAAASPEAITPCLPGWLASGFSASRLPAYASQTILRRDAIAGLVVEKGPLWQQATGMPSPAIGTGVLRHAPQSVNPYVSGTLYVLELQQLMARDEGLDAVIEWARDWLELVKAALGKNSTGLPGHWIDAIPHNFIRSADGKLANIDTEWVVSQPIPSAWVILRGLMNALAVCPTSPALSGFSLLEVVHRISASVGIGLDDAAIHQACALEADLLVIVYGQKREEVEQRLRHHLSMPPCAGISGPTSLEMFSTRCSALENEIRRVKSTVSWQVTKPLRFFANLPSLIKAWLLHRNG